MEKNKIEFYLERKCGRQFYTVIMRFYYWTSGQLPWSQRSTVKKKKKTRKQTSIFYFFLHLWVQQEQSLLSPSSCHSTNTANQHLQPFAVVRNNSWWTTQADVSFTSTEKPNTPEWKQLFFFLIIINCAVFNGTACLWNVTYWFIHWSRGECKETRERQWGSEQVRSPRRRWQRLAGCRITARNSRFSPVTTQLLVLCPGFIAAAAEDVNQKKKQPLDLRCFSHPWVTNKNFKALDRTTALIRLRLNQIIQREKSSQL